jgi:hypothetical protein
MTLPAVFRHLNAHDIELAHADAWVAFSTLEDLDSDRISRRNSDEGGILWTLNMRHQSHAFPSLCSSLKE